MNYKKRQQIARERLPTKIELLNETVISIKSAIDGIDHKILFGNVFPWNFGDELEPLLKTVIIQLCDDGLIRKEIVEDKLYGLKHTNRYHITGSGIKLCHVPFFKSKPYSYYKAKSLFQTVFTKYLPIIISTTALIISYLNYSRK